MIADVTAPTTAHTVALFIGVLFLLTAAVFAAIWRACKHDQFEKQQDAEDKHWADMTDDERDQECNRKQELCAAKLREECAPYLDPHYPKHAKKITRTLRTRTNKRKR